MYLIYDMLLHLSFVVYCTAVCRQGDIRLVAGPDERQGRVEVCNDEAWGTVCQDDFYALDATVVCVQLGFLGIGKLVTLRLFFIQQSHSHILLCKHNRSSCTPESILRARLRRNCARQLGLCWH